MFVGREKELAFLESRYTAENGQLIVLYGRRRVGKTETLKEFCKNKPHVFFACRECTDKLQLRTFSEKMLKEDIPARRYISQFENWEQAFRSVTSFARRKTISINMTIENPKNILNAVPMESSSWLEVVRRSSSVMIVAIFVSGISVSSSLLKYPE